MRTRPRLILFLLPLVFLLGTLNACGGSLPTGRVILLGLDGMDPGVVDLLMSEGKLPNFARLRQDGAYGRLLSRPPLLSPVLWTTVATGKTPDQHGIGHFVATSDVTGQEFPVTSEMRRVKSIWNMVSDADRNVAVVGWWATWPAESVNGAIVSDHTCYHFLFQQASTGAAAPTGVTHPPGLLEEITPLIRRPGDVTPAEAAPFVRMSPEELSVPFDFDNEVSHFKWALATAASYGQIGLHLWRENRPDLLMVYIEGTDSMAHLFGHLFRASELSGELGAQRQKFGGAVEQMYLYADRVVGEYIDAMDNDTTLVVLSDHGFQLGVLPDDPSKTRDLRRVSERYHNPEGILYLYGDRVRRHSRIEKPRLVDIAPTLLALVGMAPAEDMPGRVLEEVLELEALPAAIASYELSGSDPTVAAGDTSVDPQILERLRSLGYLGSTNSPQGDRNLAAMQFEAGHHEEAVNSYRRMIQEDPGDAALRTSLAGALGALGRYDEARDQLGLAIDLEPLDVEAYHNLAVIFEREGNLEEAVEQYRKAVR